MADAPSLMWTVCPVILDTPVTVCGIELYDAAAVTVLPLLFQGVLGDVLVSFGLTLALAVGLRQAQRGRPPGAWLHWLHGMQLVALPGVHSPHPTRYAPW